MFFGWWLLVDGVIPQKTNNRQPTTKSKKPRSD